MDQTVQDSSSFTTVIAWRVYVCVAIFFSLAKPTYAVNCTEDISNRVTVFSTINLQCVTSNFYEASTNFAFWSRKDNVSQIVSIVVGAPLAGQSKWAGLGFSKDGQMPGSTSMVATLNGTGGAQVRQYSLIARLATEVVPDNTGLSLVGSTEADYDGVSKIVYMAFQVDFTNSTATPNYLLFAYGPASLDGSTIDQHITTDVQKSNFVTGVTGPSTATTINRQSKAHGVVQIFGWGILLPIGAMVARYARGFDPVWFYIHVTLQSFGFVFVVAGLATGVSLANKIQPEGLAAHRGLGIFLFFLALLQVLALLLRPKKDANVRKYWNWYHGWVGRLALFLAVINIFVGIHLVQGQQKLKVGYSVILSLELIAFAVLETLLWLRWNRQAYTQSVMNDGFQYGENI